MMTDNMILEGHIEYPYKWAVGKAAARFLSELKNSKRIVGVKCPSCGKVIVPPYDVCGACFVDLGEGGWHEVGPAGEVRTFTVVHAPYPWAPVDPPFAILSVRLDGADTDLIHILKSPDDNLKVGTRVEAVFAETPPSSLMALDSFHVTDKPADSSRPTPIEKFDAKPLLEIKGNLKVPYSWSYGETLSKFFTETRDNKRIMGARCTKCGGVLVPPVGLCGKCYAPTEREWVQVGDHGRLVSWTVVYLPFPGQPTEPPYCYGMIKLDGINTQFPHMIHGAEKGKWDDLEVNMRVEAVWNENRKGDLYDIAYFKKEGT